MRYIEPDKDKGGGDDDGDSEEKMRRLQENEIIGDLSNLSIPDQSFPYHLITDTKIQTFSILDSLSTSRNSLCQDNDTKRYYISGINNALSVTDKLITQIRKLPLNQTLRIELSDVCATHDFIEEILLNFYFDSSPYKNLITGKQIVFFDPDNTTYLSICRTLESLGKMNTNCMIAQTGGRYWTLLVAGHIESHLKDVLSYVREHNNVTANELVEKKISGSLGNAGGRLKELLDMGLIRRNKQEHSNDVVRRPVYIYNTYHPFLDLSVEYPSHLNNMLKYDEYMSPYLRRRRKVMNSQESKNNE